MHQANTPEQIDLYSEYIAARYESPEGLTRFILEHEEEVTEDSLQVVRWQQKLRELDKIAIWKNDSIALTTGKTMGPVDHSFTTIFVDSLAVRTSGFYAWESAADSLFLTFGVAPSSRRVDSLFRVPINSTMYDPSLPIPQYLTDSVGLGQRFWLLQATQMNEDSTFTAQVVLTDYTLGPSWIREITVADHISKVGRDGDSGNLVVFGDDELKLAELDKYGELIAEEVVENTGQSEEENKDGEQQGEQDEEKEEGGGGS